MNKKTGELPVVEEHLRGLSGYDKQGREIPDPTPVEMPVGFKRPIPLADEIRAIMRRAVQEDLDSHGMETFDEADDFEVPDEDMTSPYEENFDPQFTFARESELRAGAVAQPDFHSARKFVEEVAKPRRGKETHEAPPPVSGVPNEASGAKA